MLFGNSIFIDITFKIWRMALWSFVIVNVVSES